MQVPHQHKTWRWAVKTKGADTASLHPRRMKGTLQMELVCGEVVYGLCGSGSQERKLMMIIYMAERGVLHLQFIITIQKSGNDPWWIRGAPNEKPLNHFRCGCVPGEIKFFFLSYGDGFLCISTIWRSWADRRFTGRRQKLIGRFLATFSPYIIWPRYETRWWQWQRKPRHIFPEPASPDQPGVTDPNRGPIRTHTEYLGFQIAWPVLGYLLQVPDTGKTTMAMVYSYKWTQGAATTRTTRKKRAEELPSPLHGGNKDYTKRWKDKCLAGKEGNPINLLWL